MLNAAVGWMRSRFMATTAPMTPQPKAATTYTSSLERNTLTPELCAARSLSRMAVSARPTRERSRKYTSRMEPTATTSARQYVPGMRVVHRAAGRRT